MSTQVPGIAQPSARFSSHVPDGLKPLLESLAREVIRNQPADMYTFALLFADNLLKIKQANGGVDPISSPALYEKFKSNLSAEAIARGLRGQKVVICPTEQTASDESKSRRRRSGDVAAKLTPERAATTIQAAARGFVCRRRVKRTRRDLEAARDARKFVADAYDLQRRQSRRRGKAAKVEQPKTHDADTTIGNVKKTSASMDPDQAATKIQAGVRGFLTRRRLSPASHKIDLNHTEHGDQLKSTIQNSHRDHNHLTTEPIIKLEDVDACASKIQAGVRGYLTRKHLEQQGVPIHHPGQLRSRSHSPYVLESSDNKLTSTDKPNHKEPKSSKKSPGISYSYDDLLKVADKGQAEDAARKIQAGIRGFLTRKHLQEKGVRVHTPHEIHLHQQQIKKEIGETSM